MTSTGTDQLDAIVNLLEECLREASVTESLARDWRGQLTARHRAKEGGVVVTTIAITYAKEVGWLTLVREGGAYKVILWAPELRIPNNRARGVIEKIQKCLEAAIPRERMQIRGITPFDWLTQKGWKPDEIARLRAA
ncbi:MAG: hypothetical protein HY474_00305 [Candidatus Sungbacteria bacterium]|uniref:Uncharacterized protein n=1 Tax=Candidatus Sungiibacteriota bacterium TaxID=2750080 RepID=A0A933DR80_9BACT|nr:hypothetical protein [Candidatus Sungbacteria bacterium]